MIRYVCSRLSRSYWMAIGAIALAVSPAFAGAAEVDRIKGNPNALILDGVRISGDMELFFLSGQLPSPIDAAKPMSEVNSLEEMGDSKTQTISTLNKIKALLKAQGYEMSDLIKLSLFVAADPRLGKMDFAGVNEGFRQFFGTTENANTVARSTFQVAGLVGPHFLIEIEAIAVRKKAGPMAGYKRVPRLPPALRKKALLAHNANGDRSRG